MSNKPINDGGPAFPGQDSGDCGYRPGMTLRDYFAGLALRTHWGSGDPMTPGDVASIAYEVADAMIAARDAK